MALDSSVALRRPRATAWSLVALIFSLALTTASCTEPRQLSGPSPNPQDTGGPPPGVDVPVPPQTDTSVTNNCPVLWADPPATSGVVYVGGFISKDVAMYRIDGPAPVKLQSFNVGGYVHELILDPYNDLLFVLQDVENTVGIYQLHRPLSANSEVVPPSFIGGIPMDGDTPKFGVADPLRKRLIVIAEPPLTSGELLTYSNLHIFDVSNPHTPVRLNAVPQQIPVTVNVALDPVNGVLFFTGMTDKNLYVYDATTIPMTYTAGSPLNLPLYFQPPSPNTGFAARNLRVDPWRGRVYAARAEGTMSELMAFNYPAATAPPTAPNSVCPERPSHANLVMQQDWFDTSLPIEMRPNLLDAYVGLPDWNTGDVLFVASAWNDNLPGTTSIVVPMNQQLDAGSGCGDYEGIGCWMQTTVNRKPMTFALTDGAACVDPARRIYVGTTLDAYDGEGPGSVLFFRYNPDMSMSPVLPTSGTSFSAPPIPIAAVCH